MPADPDQLTVDVIHHTANGPDIRTQQKITRKPGEQVSSHLRCQECVLVWAVIRPSRDHAARVLAYRTLGYTAAGAAVASVAAPMMNPRIPDVWLAISLAVAAVLVVLSVRWTVAAANVPLWVGELPGHDIRPGRPSQQWGPRFERRPRPDR